MLPTIAFYVYQLWLVCKHRLPSNVIVLILTTVILTDVSFILAQGDLLIGIIDSDQDGDYFEYGFTVFYVFSCVGISLTHWLFSFNYWMVAKKMSLVL